MRWADTQNAVLDTLRQIESDMIRQLDAGGGVVAAIEEGHSRMAASADRYVAVGCRLEPFADRVAAAGRRRIVAISGRAVLAKPARKAA